MDSTHYHPQAQLFRVLMHPVRIAILELLRSGPHCVCHFEAHLGLRQSSISQQLAILRTAGLVQDSREGFNIFYCLTQPEVLAVLDAARMLPGMAARYPPAEGIPVVCSCPECAACTPASACDERGLALPSPRGRSAPHATKGQGS